MKKIMKQILSFLLVLTMLSVPVISLASDTCTPENEVSDVSIEEPVEESDDTADVETKEDWEQTIPDLSKNLEEDVVSVAQSQIGYRESTTNFRMNADNEKQGYTRYGVWAGNAYADWNTLFVDFCLDYAGCPEDEFPLDIDPELWMEKLVQADAYVDFDSEYQVKAGNIVFLAENDAEGKYIGISDKPTVKSVGIIETVGPKQIAVIEGNSNDAVEENIYDLSADDIIGYGILPKNEIIETEENTGSSNQDSSNIKDNIKAFFGINTSKDESEQNENQSLSEKNETKPEENIDNDENLTDEDTATVINPLASYTGSGKVVLNLGNGNGKYNFADYTGSKASGTLLRYTTEALDSYADNDGNVTVRLPSDENLDSSFTFIDGTGGAGDVVFALGNATAYDYKLVGWINIATGEYYDVSEGAVTADVNLDKENVFYADWISADYDQGQQTDSNLRDDIVDTSGFVTMHIYDYNELFNLYSASLVENNSNGTLSESWTDSQSLYDSLPYGTGMRLTDSFIFVNDGTTTKAEDKNTGGMLTWPAGKTLGNSWTGSGQPPRNATDIWGITSPDSAPMNMLFDSEEKAVGVHYVGEATGLFWIDKNGYYTYNSKESAAVYNQTDECFYVYNGPQYVDQTSNSCFLPFNRYVKASGSSDSPYSAYTGTVDYWFGMDMEVNFYLPNATGTGKNQINEQDMVFNFSGDDDILIFIDDKLVLDMSGIHDESFGSIDFSDGTVKMAMSETELDSATPTYFSLSAGTHELKIYYMERGGYASNLEVQFNIASLWEYETGEVQTITADKKWLDADGNELSFEDLPEAYRNNGIEIGLFDALPEATSDTFGYTKSGSEYTVSYTDDEGVQHTFVYDSDGPKVTHQDSNGVSNTYETVNSSGQVLDNNGYVFAWLDEDTLHIRIDKQTLNDSNNWHYAWEMLDADGEYEVQELSKSNSYTTESAQDNLLRYMYWSIIGETQIEDSFETGETLQVILTEAAQEATSSLGDTKDALGYVIVASSAGIKTEQIEFSQIAELQETDNEKSGSTSYKTVTGVTTQSEVNSLGPGAVWYVKDAESQNTDISGYTLKDFSLYCQMDGNIYWLTLNGTASSGYMLGITTDSNDAGVFYYDVIGELMTLIDENDAVRVEILEDGTIALGEAEFEAARNDVRIFTLQETETSGFTFMAVNTLLPDFTLEKTDSITGASLPGVQFTMQDENGLYYVYYDEDTGETVWSDEPTKIKTNADGRYVFHHLSDGIYILTETEPADDSYTKLPTSINIMIQDGNIISAEWSSDVGDAYRNLIGVSEDGMTLSVQNQQEIYTLPNAGGSGILWYLFAGLLLITVSGIGLFLYRRKVYNR